MLYARAIINHNDLTIRLGFLTSRIIALHRIALHGIRIVYT